MRLITGASFGSAAIGFRGIYDVHIGTGINKARGRDCYVNIINVQSIIPLIRLCYNLDYVEYGGWIRVRK